MTRHGATLGPDYFEGMFQGTDDPWDLETSPYEQGKFQDSIDALSGRAYTRALEIGCAKGVLTQKLAPSCSALLAVDVSKTALDAARQRCAALEHVTLRQMAFPAEAPEGLFDLIVLSEVVYYWDDGDIALAAERIGQCLAPGGDLLLVHWIGETDYPQSGDDAVTKLSAALDATMEVVIARREPCYRLDLWRRAD
ncbi:MAG: SAM-dependent methyltransferase [Sphingobium sp.]